LEIQLRWEFLLPLIAGVVVGIAAWFFFLAIFAFRIRRNDTFNTVINVAYFVLMFVSSMFYPLDSVPSWLRTLAMGNPLTWHTDVLRYFTIGLGDPQVIIWEIIGFTLFLIMSFWVAVKSLQKAA
jgi:ABC-2 type transport system permease protein